MSVGDDVPTGIDGNARPDYPLAPHGEIGRDTSAFFPWSAARHEHLHDALLHALHQRFDRPVQLLQGVESSGRALGAGGTR
jgi:hypothetical protein